MTGCRQEKERELDFNVLSGGTGGGSEAEK